MKLIANSISLSPMEPISAAAAAVAPEVTVNNAERRSDKKEWNSVDEAVRVDNASSIRYSNVKANTDLEYVLEGNNVKENIIIKSAGGSYVYTFELGLLGLTPALREDGSISLSDVETGESEYIIPAPYMFDADGEYSYEVYYTLTEKSEGVYTLKITADSEWINAENREFPVTVDPTIVTDSTMDTYVDSNAPSSTHGSLNELWISPTKTTYIYTSLPDIPSNSTLKSVKLFVAYYYYDYVTSNTLTASAYQVNIGWTENTFTWNSANNYSNLGTTTTALSSASFPGSVGAYASSPKWVSFDITNAANNWRSGVINNGIAIKRTSGTNGSVILKSSETGSYCPYISVTYLEPRIADGVYKIRNIGTDTYVDTTEGGTASGTQLQQWTGLPTYGTRNQLYKITFINVYDNINYYTVRPLTNCGQGMNIPAVGGTATLEDLPTTDTWGGTPWNQSIGILDVNSGYVIKSGNDLNSQYLTAPSSGENGTKLYSSSAIYNTSIWELIPYTTPIDGAAFTSYDYDVIAGETAYYKSVMYNSTIGINGPTTYFVLNEDGTSTNKATINSTTGVLTALKPGTIRVCTTYDGSSSYWYRTLTIEPSFVQDLVDNNLTSYSDIRKTDDGFYMLMTPLADILASMGIYTIKNKDNYLVDVVPYCDDWYLYAVKNGAEYSYSLLKMREKKDNGDLPGVTISFVELDYDKLTILITNGISSNVDAFSQCFVLVTNKEICDYCPTIANYFSQTASNAPYLIAEEYIKIVANTEADGYIDVPNNFKLAMNTNSSEYSERLRTAILQNNYDAGYNVYDVSNDRIIISNPNNLTEYEKYAILISYTADVTFNSFAAEVEFHADFVRYGVPDIPVDELEFFNEFIDRIYYTKALRADMSVDNGDEYYLKTPYYELDSYMVIQQAQEHGEY